MHLIPNPSYCVPKILWQLSIVELRLTCITCELCFLIEIQQVGNFTMNICIKLIILSKVIIIMLLIYRQCVCLMCEIWLFCYVQLVLFCVRSLVPRLGDILCAICVAFLCLYIIIWNTEIHMAARCLSVMECLKFLND